jgi:hypothetical protein
MIYLGMKMREAWWLVLGPVWIGGILDLVLLLWGPVWASIGPLGVVMAILRAHTDRIKANRTPKRDNEQHTKHMVLETSGIDQ